jgi:catechol 2,3-dioxygenase-like lactoylglutathione lyase family enzyme
MAANIAGIDHAIIGVRDLEKAREVYERLGFRATPRGRHVGWGTANYCLMFQDDYLEILGIVDPTAETNNLDRFLETREGLLSIVLRSDDAAATKAAWAKAGLDPADVKDLSRLLEPDTELRFQNVTLNAEATADVPMFACSHLTPAKMRQPGWTEHPNGALGIHMITAVTNDPAAAIEPMERVFGSAKITETDNTVAVHTGRGVILFATPDDLDMLHPQLRTNLETEQATLAVLSVRVRDLAGTAAWLNKVGVPFSRESSGMIGVGASHAHGVMLEFTA